MAAGWPSVRCEQPGDGDTNAVTDVFLHDRILGPRHASASGRGARETEQRGTDHQRGWPLGGVRVLGQQSRAGDTNGDLDVFVYDRSGGNDDPSERGSGGTQANDFSSAGGDQRRWPLGGVQVRRPTTSSPATRMPGRTCSCTTGRRARRRASAWGPAAPRGGFSDFPAISADGRWVGFESFAHNLVANDTNDTADVFVHDRQTGATTRVSVGASGTQGNGLSQHTTISADGRLVAFESRASNLVSDDTNAASDVFVRDRGDAGCAVTLSSLAALAPADAANQSVLALAPVECAWTAVSNDPSWLAVTSPESSAGFGVVSYNVAANTGEPRTGTLTIGGVTFTVTQASDTTPMAPEGLVAYTVVGNAVTLTWTVSPVGPRPTGFVLEGGVNPGEILASIPTGSTAPAFAVVAPSGSYYVRLHALNGSFRSRLRTKFEFT